MHLFEYLTDLVIFDGDFTDFSEINDVYNGIMVFICVGCAGLAAGLTIGLLSLDVTKLEIKSMTGSRNEKKAALQVLPIVKKHHLLLVTLLLFNSLANETLPIFLGSLVPNYVAIILSVTLVLFFGEIIPSAIFTGRDQLLTAARMTNVVYFLLTLFYPIAFPISKLLDHILGADDVDGKVSRSELEALMVLQTKGTDKIAYPSVLHRNHISAGKDIEGGQVPEGSEMLCLSSSSTEQNDSDRDDVNGLSVREVTLMTGILRLAKMSIAHTMIRLNRVYMISGDTRLDERGLYSILDSGYSRVLVHKRNDKSHFLGYLLVKELIVINPQDNIKASKLTLREPIFARPETGLLEMLNIFQSGQCHLALVSSDPEESLRCLRSGERCPSSAEVQGIITLEDVIEKIIQDDILDETDSNSPRSRGSQGAQRGDAHGRHKSRVIVPQSASTATSPRSRGNTTTVLYRQLVNVNSRRASCPDLVSCSPSLQEDIGRRRLLVEMATLGAADAVADTVGDYGFACDLDDSPLIGDNEDGSVLPPSYQR